MTKLITFVDMTVKHGAVYDMSPKSSYINLVKCLLQRKKKATTIATHQQQKNLQATKGHTHFFLSYETYEKIYTYIEFLLFKLTFSMLVYAG